MTSQTIVAATHTVPDVSVGHALLQMVLALAVIVACIYGLSKVLARMRSGPSARGPKRQAKTGLSIISRQSLGKDLSIAAIKWGDREVLVGISGSTITFLNDARSGEEAGDLDADAAERSADPEPERPARRSAPFSPALLANAATRRMTSPSPPPAMATVRASRPSLLEALRDATLRR